jgi:hypothetical protein
LNNGKSKYPEIGAIIKDEVSGHLYGYVDMVPIQGWDGKFMLFVPKFVKEKAEEVATAEQDVGEQPF